MLKRFAKQILRPLSGRIMFRADKIAQQRALEVQTFLSGRMESLSGEMNRIEASFSARMNGFSDEMGRIQSSFSEHMNRLETSLSGRMSGFSEELNRRLAEAQRQIDRLRVDLYFAQLCAGRVFTPSRAVELRLPESAIEMVLCGPAGGRGVVQAIANQDGYYEPYLVAALSRVISATASCIDIGAGIGAISLQLSKIAPKGHVHAFEPEPASFGYLTQNIAANDIVNITAYNMRTSGGSEDPGLNRAWNPSGETIQCVSLDEWASKSNIPAVDFIRLDAEGMEPAILRGADELLRRERPDLAIEFVAQSGNDPGHGSAQRLYRMLKTYWEQIYLIPRNMSDQLVPINDFDHLVRLIETGSGREYLFCTADKRQRTRVHASAH